VPCDARHARQLNIARRHLNSAADDHFAFPMTRESVVDEAVRLGDLHARIHPATDEIMVCLRGYFDDSGKHDDPNLNAVSLAGYLGTVQAWENFEVLWGAVLSRFAIPYFHMKELIGRKGAFMGWKEDDPRIPRLFAAMAQAIGEAGLEGYGAPLLTDALDRFNAEHGLAIGAYPFTLYATVLEIGLHHPEDDMQIVLDRVDRGSAKAAAAEGYARRDPWYGEALRWPDILPLGPKSPITSRNTYGLQAADFAAWEVRQSTVLKGNWIRQVKPTLDQKDWFLGLLMSQRTAKGITSVTFPKEIGDVVDRKSFAALLRAAPLYARVWDYDALRGVHEAKNGRW
jgi:hypothetical protein